MQKHIINLYMRQNEMRPSKSNDYDLKSRIKRIGTNH
jgi:hypothetical protein